MSPPPPALMPTTPERGKPPSHLERAGSRPGGRSHLLVPGLLLALVLSLLAATTPGSAGALLARITNSTNQVASARYFTCNAVARATSPQAYLAYPLQDPLTVLTVNDVSGNNRTGTYYGMPTRNTSTACARDTGGSMNFNGTSTYLVSPTAGTAPNTFTIEVWFRTTTAGGYLLGFSNRTTTATTASNDRHLYLTTTGRVAFGVNPGTLRVITSPLAYNDGTWHHAAATLGTDGMNLYIDGKPVASSTAATTGQANSGVWRAGHGILTTWPGTATNHYFTGQLSYATVYTTTLPASTIAEHYTAGS